MNILTRNYIGNHKFIRVSADVFALRGESVTVLIYEHGERSFFASFRLRFAGPENHRHPVPR